MISLERLLGDEIYYYDDEESFASQIEKIMTMEANEQKYRSIAQKYDWRQISLKYEEVLKMAAKERTLPDPL
jgi:hypothetical protein